MCTMGDILIAADQKMLLTLTYVNVEFDYHVIIILYAIVYDYKL